MVVFLQNQREQNMFNNEELLNSQRFGLLGFVSLIPLLLFLSQEIENPDIGTLMYRGTGLP